MASKAKRVLDLETLGDGRIPVISKEDAGFYKQNCMICFARQGHGSGVEMKVDYGKSTEQIKINWLDQVTESLRRQYDDLRRATDHAACAIALLLVRELTEFKAIEQASIGTTVDYYLVPKDQQDDTLIFNYASRLEVSGILRATETNTVDGRVESKFKRLKPQDDLPALIVVVEFSEPRSKMVDV